MGARRVPRRRHVLRPLRFPDHVAARRRVGATRRHQLRRILGAAGASPAPRAAARAPRRRRLRRARSAGRAARRPARRRTGHPFLRRELALHRVGSVVLRTVHRGVAAAAHVVTRDRRAVLSRVAADHVRVPAPRAWAALAPRPRVRGRRGGVDRGHGLALRPERPVPGVLRHRRPRAPAAHRSRPGAHSDPLDSAALGALDRERARFGRRRRVRRLLGVRPRHGAVDVPRRVRGVRRVRRRRHHLGGAARSVRVAVVPLAAAARVDRAYLLRPVPVALARDRRGLSGADRSRWGATHRRARRTDVRPRHRVLLPGRAADPPGGAAGTLGVGGVAVGVRRDGGRGPGRHRRRRAVTEVPPGRPQPAHFARRAAPVAPGPTGAAPSARCSGGGGPLPGFLQIAS